MNLSGRTATWLELAVKPPWRRHQATIRLHPVGGDASDCLALSLDGRWVCTGRQRLTVIRGIDAALHFLQILQIDDFRSRGRAVPRGPGVLTATTTIRVIDVNGREPDANDTRGTFQDHPPSIARVSGAGAAKLLEPCSLPGFAMCSANVLHRG